jgi:hypothetical protein
VCRTGPGSLGEVLPASIKAKLVQAREQWAVADREHSAVADGEQSAVADGSR